MLCSYSPSSSSSEAGSSLGAGGSALASAAEPAQSHTTGAVWVELGVPAAIRTNRNGSGAHRTEQRRHGGRRARQRQSGQQNQTGLVCECSANTRRRETQHQLKKAECEKETEKAVGTYSLPPGTRFSARGPLL